MVTYECRKCGWLADEKYIGFQWDGKPGRALSQCCPNCLSFEVRPVDDLARTLAATVLDELHPECTCRPPWKDRDLADPHCQYCEIGYLLIPLAKKVLNGN